MDGPSRRSIALLVALVLHLVVVLGLPSPVVTPRREAVTPLRVRRILLPVPAPAPAERWPAPPVVSHPAPPVPPPAPVATAPVVGSEMESAPPPLARARGPRRVELFPQRAIDAATQAPPAARRELSDEDLGQRRLDEWAEAFARNNEPALDRSPEIVALQERLEQWFVPADEIWSIVGVEKRSLADTLLPEVITGLPETVAKHLEDGKMLEMLDGSSDPYWDSPARESIEKFEELSDSKVAGGGPNCAGACGESHAQSTLVTLIEIDHDLEGKPSAWRVAKSSGITTFDEAAVGAVADAVTWLDETDDPQRPAEWSQWSFGAVAYQWTRGSLLLDPQFEPPGKPLASKSDWKAETTVVKTVRLVAVRYRGGSDDGDRGDPAPLEPGNSHPRG